MTEHLITNASNDGERITALSGPGWGPYPVDVVIAVITTGSTFCTIGPLGKVWIEVVHEPPGPPYVRSYANLTRADNLLSLPSCGAISGGLAAALNGRFVGR